VCLDGTSCRTNCVREVDCIDGYYCASDGTCQQRMSTSTSSHCTKDQQCQSRVCMGTCVQCDKDDDCPRNLAVCLSNVCTPCDDNVPAYWDAGECHENPIDGSFQSEYRCGTRTYPQSDYSCSCGSSNECPIGSICDNNTCLIRGGQPCVTNNCAFGSCTNGVCPMEPGGKACTVTSLSRAGSSGCSGTCTTTCSDASGVPYGFYSCCQ
jgi:hypothetical protein